MTIDIEKLVNAMKNMKVEEAEDEAAARAEFNERLAKFGVTTDYLAFFNEMIDSNPKVAKGLDTFLVHTTQEVTDLLAVFADACKCMPESVQKTAAALMAGKLIGQACEFITYFKLSECEMKPESNETAKTEPVTTENK